MSHQSELIYTDIDAYLTQHEHKELLRFLTCGSVDDGKSTLIGRLLYDAKMIYEDQLAAIRRDSAVHGTTGGDFDPALLTDGLKAEREQGITIDVAYRYFSTAKRKFIIADAPGHEQYTRNMATGASTCDLAVILIDASQGVLTQTRRHSFITSLLGIKHIVVAVNKMDLVDFSQEIFAQIKTDYTGFASKLDMKDLHFIPISALHGDNVVDSSTRMPWYQGGTLMHLLENVHIASDRNLIDFRFPVQYVNRPDRTFRGYCGTIASGVIRPGDEVMVLPSRKTSRVRSVLAFEGELTEAFAPLAVTLTLEDEIDVSRGDMLVHCGNVPTVTQKFDAMVVWMSEAPLVPGKPYYMKQTTKMMTGSVAKVRYQIDVNTLHRVDAATLRLNEIGRCMISANEPLTVDAYRRNRSTGAFIIIDRLTNVTIAAGMILDQKSSEEHLDPWEVQPQSAQLRGRTSSVTAAERSARFAQRPVTLLLTGLTGAGKTTIAYALERRLFDLGHASCVLDGQNMRLGISRDLGFSSDERAENLRRSAEVARLMNDGGLICIAALVAPSEESRQRAQEVVGTDQFIVVHVSAPLEVCRARDPSGMYAMADSGKIANFPGVTAPYEPPETPDLVVPTDEYTCDECADQIIQMLRDRQVIED